MVAIPALILAAVDYLLSRRDSRQVAKDFDVSENDLAATYHRAQAHSWPVKLAAALNDPLHRPDTLLIKRHLAHFEQQYGELLVQYQYAMQTCEKIRTMKQVDPSLLLKADSLAFRIHQASTRILRDIQKAELRLEKAEKSPPPATDVDDAAPPSSRQPEAPREDARNIDPKPTGSLQDTATNSSQQQNAESGVAQEASSMPSEEEFKSVIFKHRHRIKDAKPSDRPALIAKLIQQEREKQSPDQLKAA